MCLLGFLDLLTRAQCCRVDDQRGLLTKEQLELPLFLQLSLDQEKLLDENRTESSSASEPRKAKKEESRSGSTQSSAVTAEKSPDSHLESDAKILQETTKSEGKNLKETAV